MTPPSRHEVRFLVEDGCIFVQSITCLAAPGAECRVGCRVAGCEDWGHGEEGCECCQEDCECACIVHSDCSRGLDTCRCATRLEHADACPHAFADLGHCWLTPWVTYDYGYDCFHDDRTVQALLQEQVIRGRDEHPAERWRLTMNCWDEVDLEHFHLTEPDLGSLQRDPQEEL